MKAIVAVLDRKGKDAVQAAVSMLKILGRGSVDAFSLATQNHAILEKSLEKLKAEGFKSSTAIGHVFLKVLAHDKPQHAQIEKAAFVFDGRIYSPPVKTLKDFIAQKLQTDGKAAAQALIRELDGCFAFAMAKDEKLFVGRDALGLYPLYYGENGNVFAFASERKALWKIGIKETRSFPPGHLIIADKKGLKIRPIKVLKHSLTVPASMGEAAEKLQLLLEQSTKERVHGLNEVAVAFSGGLDSSLTAWLAKRVKAKVHLIHVSLENQPETEQAEKAASLLDMPFHKYLYDERDLEQTLPKVLLAIEDHNPAMAGIGVPIFWATEKAAELGFRVLFTGQGADEYFGGYKRYSNFYKSFGEEAAKKAMVHDILTMYENNFERDNKICAFNNIELRLPFAAYPIAEFAFNLPLNMKIESPSDPLRKAVLRKVAEKFGLPPQIVGRPKRAVQYATGIAKAVERLAKRERLTVKQLLQKRFIEAFDEFYGCF